MSIRKKSLLVAGAVVLALGSLAFSQTGTEAAAETSAEKSVEEAVDEAAGESAAEAEEQAAAAEESAASPEESAAAVAEEPEAAAEEPAVVKEEPAAAKAGLTVTPYGRAHYRFRGQINTRSGLGRSDIETDTGTATVTNKDSKTIAGYTNKLAWQLGLKAAVNEQLSMQFQIGNDWGSPEDVSYALNNGVRSRFLSGVSLTRADTGITGATLSGYQNLYVHLAYARWNPGYLFIEAGVVPLVSNGTLDLLESSLSRGRYQETVFDWWTQYNSSMIGFKIGKSLYERDVKVSAELFQTVIDPRGQSMSANFNLANDPTENPASVLLVFDVPIEAGSLKVTPEFTGVINRNYNKATKEADHEFIGGLSASYKISDALSFSFIGGSGAVSNENSKVGSYDTPNITANPPILPVRVDSIPAVRADTIIQYKSRGFLIGAGTSVKVGSGNIQLNINYNNAQNGLNDSTVNATKYGYINADLRYAWRVNKNFSIMPRYRPDIVLYPKNHRNDKELRHRFELVFEGSF
jgi:hypothetical protein